MVLERTLIIVKPDGVVRGYVGEVLRRFEMKGLKIVALKMLKLERSEAERLYAVHKGKPFYEELIGYITSAPIVVAALEGNEAISVVRKIIGPTNPKEAEPGTIRGDLGLTVTKNVIHASDSKENAAYELSIFFGEKDYVKYEREG
ncbi:MAG: nucleoside-diphosphate kinase [Candidatus Nezhaarchaeales archaeon]